MRATKFIKCVLALTLTALEVTNTQFGYPSKNWQGLAFRNIPIYPNCLPDESPCERITDCCTNYCRSGYPVSRCEPSPCGCPQPPWTPEPITEVCLHYGVRCGQHKECCTGYCLLRCLNSPCLECE